MKDLLRNLEKEARNLTTKQLGPIGFDYRRRTRIERTLFLIAKELCAEKLNYSLRGLGESHLNMFLEKVDEQESRESEVEFVVEVFEISEIICDVSGSNPYLQEQRLEELGGTISNMLVSLRGKILALIGKCNSI